MSFRLAEIVPNYLKNFKNHERSEYSQTGLVNLSCKIDFSRSVFGFLKIMSYPS